MAGTRPSRRAPRRRQDRGALTLFVAILFPALLAFAGLVADAGTKLDNYENAATYAQEAARAGAGEVDQSAAYGGATVVVDQIEAITAARAYLTAAGVSGTVTTAGADAIQVTVTITTPTKVLSIIGIDTVTSTSTATASLLSGVTGAGT
ncbi:MAG TPA: pilus assembly protein TadG-related protein [Streptosporangiaceae bacterium]|nr:pilus assembly protein TadG-related protein [Streptosporangiaceae bacterium]